MIGLHMVDDQVVQGALSQQILDILQQLPADRPIHRIEEDALLIQQQVGVVAHTSGNGMNVLKQMEPVIIGSHPVQIFRNIADTIHGDPSFLFRPQ